MDTPTRLLSYRRNRHDKPVFNCTSLRLPRAPQTQIVGARSASPMSGTESATCEAQACRSGCLRSPSTKGQRWARRWFTCFTHPESATKMAVPQARRHRTDCETMVANIAPQLTRTTYLKRLDSGASNFAIPAQQLSSRKYVYVCCVRVFADVGDKMYASPIQHATILQRNPRLQFPAERNGESAIELHPV